MLEDEIKKTDEELVEFRKNTRLLKLQKAEFKPKEKPDEPVKAPEAEKPEEKKPETSAKEEEEEAPKIHGMSLRTWDEKPAAERQKLGEKKDIKAGEAPIAPSYEVADASKHQTREMREGKGFPVAYSASGGKGGQLTTGPSGKLQTATEVSTQRVQRPNPEEHKEMMQHLESNPAIDYEGKEIPVHPKGGKGLKGQGPSKSAWSDMVDRARENIKLNEGKKPSEGELGDALQENPKNWKYFVGRSETEQKGVNMKYKKAMELLTAYLFEEMQKSLSASMYSDYTEDIMDTLTKSFIEDRELVFDEIVKMSEEEEQPNPFEALFKAQMEISENLKKLTEDFETLKKSKQDEVKPTEPVIEKKEEAPTSPAEEIPKVEKYAEGVPTNVPNHELPADSNESIKTGDVTVAGQKMKEGVKIPPVQEAPKISHNAFHDDSALPKMTMHTLGKEEENAFEAGKKLGEMEAIKKQVEETGVSAPRPGVVEQPLRESIIEKITADEKALLNTSWGKLEKQYIQQKR